MRHLLLLLITILSSSFLSHEESIPPQEASSYSFSPTGTLWLGNSLSIYVLLCMGSELEKKIKQGLL